MENLFDTPLKVLPKWKGHYGSDCHYQLFNKEGKVLMTRINGACHGSWMKSSEFLLPKIGNKILFYITVSDCAYSESDLLKWVEYLNLCGFPFHYKGIESVKIGSGYGRLDGEVYILRAECSEYINSFHMFAAATLMRLIYYTYSENLHKIPEAIFLLKKELGDKLTPIGAACLAHMCTGNYDYGHSFIGDNGVCNLTTKEFLTKIENNKDGTIYLNDILSSSLLGDYYHTSESLTQLYKQKNFDSIAKQMGFIEEEFKEELAA